MKAFFVRANHGRCKNSREPLKQHKFIELLVCVCIFLWAYVLLGYPRSPDFLEPTCYVFF